ncbi:MAG: hydrolase 2, exosortase A system-associated [Nitrococcus sp.]|nr:hydrolase 2, exosortase A system-associated [Nitrococcus sp.]
MSNGRLRVGFVSGRGGRLHVTTFAVERARGVVVAVAPFAEEMNKARRMMALQARRFQAAGYAVVLQDPLGCGESEGDFANATWATWIADLQDCVEREAQRFGSAPVLWGVRLGAVMACEVAHRLPACERLILWQPVVSGDQALNQFLRLRIASELASAGRERVSDLRARLAAGEALEVGGYEIRPELALPLAQATLTPPQRVGIVDWFELAATPRVALSPGAARAVESWRQAGWRVAAHNIAGDPFWATQEIAVVPELIERTAAALVAHSFGRVPCEL